MEAASDAKFDGEVEVLKKTLTVAAIAVRRRDTFRVREVLSIPGNNPDAETLLWQDMLPSGCGDEAARREDPYQRRSSRVRSLLGRRRADAGAVF